MATHSPTDFYTGAYTFLETLARLPWGIPRVISYIFCEVVFWVMPQPRQTIMRNLAVVYPEDSTLKRLMLANKTMRHYASYYADLLKVTLSDPLPPREEYFDELTGFEHLTAALNSDNGALMVTPHLGNWELGMLVMEDYKHRMAAVTAPIKSPVMRQKMEDFRARNGIDLVTLDRPEEYLFILKRLLTKKKLVTMLVDRHVGGHAMSVSFFGKTTQLPCGYLYLARMFEAPVLPCFILRNSRNKYSCIAEKPIHVERTDDRDADIRRALEQVVSVMESYIRAHIHQWYCFAPGWDNEEPSA